MSFLKKPETVGFNPSNKSHRVAVRLYMKRKAWGDSPLRFAHDPAFSNVVDQVQTKLLQWFLDQEDTRDKKRAENKPSREVVKASTPALSEVKISAKVAPKMLKQA
jgi:hypothetical protein